MRLCEGGWVREGAGRGLGGAIQTRTREAIPFVDVLVVRVLFCPARVRWGGVGGGGWGGLARV